MRESAFKLSSILSLCLFVSCAVKERPPGGPEDKTPPTILNVVPEPGSTMIPPDTRFKITFSKNMNTGRTEEAVFLTPVFWQYPRMKWAGRTLTIVPPEDLRPDKTYLITIGADALGHHGNRMGKSYSFAFSTGEKIDSCSVKGVVFIPYGTRASFDIWVYAVEDTSNIEFTRQIPEYATQVDSLGRFAVENMKAGTYLVVAIDDKNNDLFWEPTTELIGLPPFLVGLDESESFHGLVLRAERRDTVTAYVSRAAALDNRRLEIEFSQPVSDTSFFRPSYFEIIAGDDSSTLEIDDVYSIESGKWILETRTQTEKRNYRLIPLGIVSDWGILFDYSGIGFVGSGLVDTSGPRLIAADPGGNFPAYQDSVINLLFSERVNPARFADAVKVIADSVDTIPFIPQWTAPISVRLRLPNRVPREKRIEVVLNPDSIIDIAGNSIPDSAVAFSFRLPPADTVGEVTALSEPRSNIKGVLSSAAGSGPVYEADSDRGGSLVFGSVLPGIYRLEYYDDADRDGRWSSGRILPFSPAERFSFLPDTVSVRSRWTTEIGKIDLPVADK